MVLEAGRAGELSRLNVPANARDLDLSPDGTLVACAGANGTAYLIALTPKPAEAKKEPSPKK